MQAYRNEAKVIKFTNALKKYGISFTKVGDNSIRIYDTFTCVIVHNREEANARFQADDIHYITVGAIETSIAFVQLKLAEAKQKQQKEQPSTWKPKRYKKENNIRRNKCIKTKVDPSTLQTQSNRKPIGMSQLQWERLQGL